MEAPRTRGPPVSLKELREEHIKSLLEPSHSTKWLLCRGPPSKEPDGHLLAYHARKGGSFAVSGVSGPGFGGTVTFVAGDMITDAYESALKWGEARVGLLNMANSELPGGGFLGGARAQEEQLCHRTDLFPRLKLHKYFTAQHGERHIAKGTCLVTRNVCVLRDGNFVDVPPVNLTILSAAATCYESATVASKDRNLTKNLIQTWKAVISGANAAGVDVLIVGALGCGAFCNPAIVVGGALREALTLCDAGSLQEVRVVILEDHNSDGRNFLNFKSGYDTGI